MPYAILEELAYDLCRVQISLNKTRTQDEPSVQTQELASHFSFFCKCPKSVHSKDNNREYEAYRIQGLLGNDEVPLSLGQKQQFLNGQASDQHNHSVEPEQYHSA